MQMLLESVHDLQLPEVEVELYEILFNHQPVNDTKVAYDSYTMQSILAYKAKNGGSEK